MLKVLCDQEKSPELLADEYKTHISPFSYFLFHSFLSTPLYTLRFTHTLALWRTDERKLMLDQCLVQEADLAV